MNAKEVLKTLYGHGFRQVSQKGSILNYQKMKKRLLFQFMEQRIYLLVQSKVSKNKVALSYDKKDLKMEYIAFIHKENDNYVAAVPDLGYTSSFGSTFTEAVHNIVEACELYAEDEEELPVARSLEKLTKDEELELNATPQLINVKVNKNVRINVMLPAGLLRAVNTKAEENYHGNRSAYIQDLMQRDISLPLS